MDFDLDAAQLGRRDALAAVLADHAHARPSGRADAWDAELDAALAASSLVTDPTMRLLDRVLLVEEAARVGAPVNRTAVLLLRGVIDGLPGGPIAVALGGAGQPCRFAGGAQVLVDVSGEPPRAGRVAAGSLVLVASGMVDGYGSVATEETTPAAWLAPISPSLTFCLGRAAEVSGAARAALELTVDHLNRRHQFGHSLSSLQAVRHRMSELAVDIESLAALVRFAADRESESAVLAACALAVDVIPGLVRELHQLSGARGFVHESGLPARTMQLTADRAELIQAGMSDVAFAEATWS